MGSVDQHSSALASKLGLWTFQAVEDRMVEAMRIWWRSPGKVGPGSTNPYASDIPAEMMVKSIHAGDYDALGIDRSANDVPIRSAAMTRADVEQRDMASDWIAFVPERDRKLVTLALIQLAAGHSHISWVRLRKSMGMTIGAGGLQRRYSRAITAIVQRLNSGDAGC